MNLILISIKTTQFQSNVDNMNTDTSAKETVLQKRKQDNVYEVDTEDEIDIDLKRKRVRESNPSLDRLLNGMVDKFNNILDTVEESLEKVTDETNEAIKTCAQNHHKQLTQQVDELKKKTEEQNKQLEEQHKELTKNLHTSSMREAMLTKQTNELKMQLEEQEKIIKRIQKDDSDLIEVQNKYTEHLEETKALKADYDVVQADFQAMQVVFNDIVTENESLKEENKAGLALIATLQEEKKKLEEQQLNQAKVDENESLLALNQTLEEENKELKKCLQKVKDVLG